MRCALLLRAQALAMRSNNEIILHDLPQMCEAELMAVINYLVRLQDC